MGEAGVCLSRCGLRATGNSLLLPQPCTLQVLEVLTAAVEYGLEELREVGFCARPRSCFPCPSQAQFTYTLVWRGMCAHPEKRVAISRWEQGVGLHLFPKGSVHVLCVLGAHGGYFQLVL